MMESKVVSFSCLSCPWLEVFDPVAMCVESRWRRLRKPKITCKTHIPRHPSLPAEVRYLDLPNIPKTPNLRRYDWMSRAWNLNKLMMCGSFLFFNGACFGSVYGSVWAEDVVTMCWIHSSIDDDGVDNKKVGARLVTVIKWETPRHPRHPMYVVYLPISLPSELLTCRFKTDYTLSGWDAASRFYAWLRLFCQ